MGDVLSMLGLNPLIFWTILIVVFVVVEAFTLALTSIWFAVGALGALIASALGAGFFVQLVVFLAVTIIMLVYTRPIAQKVLKIGNVKTNVDAMIGKRGIVTKEINEFSYGQVKVGGQVWTSKSSDDSTIGVGEEVEIIAVEGVKAIVQRIDDN